MNVLVYHIVSGQSFFTGITLLILAVVASTVRHRLFSRVSFLGFVVGAIAVVVSSTAIPYWYYAVVIVVTLGWIAAVISKTFLRKAAIAAVIVWLIAALIELPFHLMPLLHRSPDRSIAIIGDSVTAGIGGDETSETWPSILAREHQLTVQDISHMGETISSALTRVKVNPITAPVVILEIGGNDILGSTSSAQFINDLNALLKILVASNRQIVMFELPLPPFCHEYGRAQRVLAARHNVVLIPKRIFLSVIANRNSTLDSIHLSQAGHQLMADSVWRLLKSAFGDSSADLAATRLKDQTF